MHTPHIRFIQIDQNTYHVPQRVLAELGVSFQRTGRTPQLDRAVTVFRTLFTLPADMVEEMFMAAGQADGIAAEGVEDSTYEFSATSRSPQSSS